MLPVFVMGNFFSLQRKEKGNNTKSKSVYLIAIVFSTLKKILKSTKMCYLYSEMLNNCRDVSIYIFVVSFLESTLPKCIAEMKSPIYIQMIP